MLKGFTQIFRTLRYKNSAVLCDAIELTLLCNKAQFKQFYWYKNALFNGKYEQSFTVLSNNGDIDVLAVK